MNWRDIDVTSEAGRQQLRRIVAEKAGWRFEQRDSRRVLISPQGDVMLDAPPLHPELEWGIVLERGIIPDYPNDLNAVASLFASESEVPISFTREDGMLTIQVGNMIHTHALRLSMYESMLHYLHQYQVALICLAWLAYMDAKVTL